MLLHPVLAVDAISGEPLGLADIALWNRDKQNELHHARRPLEQKESRKWLNGARRANEVLAKARRITVVSDRENDLYEDFVLKPQNVHVLIRSSSNRNFGNGRKLFDHAAALPEAGVSGATFWGGFDQTARAACRALVSSSCPRWA